VTIELEEDEAEELGEMVVGLGEGLFLFSTNALGLVVRESGRKDPYSPRRHLRREVIQPREGKRV
jgi:hypothetical protein